MENLSLSGGAFKSSAFIGAIKYLEEHGHMKEIKNVVGSSAGAIIGLLTCIGFTADEMRLFVLKEVQGFVDHEVELDNIFNIFYTLGVDDGRAHVQVFERALSFKKIPPRVTFGQLQDHTSLNLVICGSNLTTATYEYFSAKESPDMEVVLAVRISMSIPYIVQPVFYNNMVYVDASLFNNNPSDYFETDSISLIIKSDETSISSLDDLNILSFTKLMLTSVFKRLNQNKNTNTTASVDIYINDDDFDFDTFKLKASAADIEKYIEIGYTTMQTQMLTKTQTLED